MQDPSPLTSPPPPVLMGGTVQDRLYKSGTEMAVKAV